MIWVQGQASMNALQKVWHASSNFKVSCYRTASGAGIAEGAGSNDGKKQGNPPSSTRSAGSADAAQSNHRVAFRTLAGVAARACGCRKPAARRRRFKSAGRAQPRSFLRLKEKPRVDARGSMLQLWIRPWPGGFRCWPIRRPERRTPRLPGFAPAPPSAGAPACPRSSAAPACERPRRAGSCHGH